MPDGLLGSLPAGWAYTTLGEACVRSGGDIQTGPFGSQLHASDYVTDGTPAIMPTNIRDSRVNERDIARIGREDLERLQRYRVQVGDIVYPRRGDVEKRALIGEQEDGWLCGTGCLRVRFGAGKVDASYAAHYLGHSRVRDWIKQHAHGATMPNLNTAILSELPFVIPPLEEQRAIARVLGALDDKIELNRRTSGTLEEMARALFRSWFVDFDAVFAKAEGRPSGLPPDLDALFPASFEASELGETPAGWEVKTLGDIAVERRLSVSPQAMAPETPYIGLDHMPRRSLALSEWGTADGLASNKSSFGQGDILFGKLRPYFHKVGVAPVDGVCSTDIVVLSPKSPDWFGFVLGHASSKEFVDYTDAASTGTRMPRTKWKDMARYSIPLPDRTLAAAFAERVEPWVTRIASAIHESRAIAAQRDALLPQLVSGRISTL